MAKPKRSRHLRLVRGQTRAASLATSGRLPTDNHFGQPPLDCLVNRLSIENSGKESAETDVWCRSKIRRLGIHVPDIRSAARRPAQFASEVPPMHCATTLDVGLDVALPPDRYSALKY
jgi:hypothetical protein